MMGSFSARRSALGMTRLRCFHIPFRFFATLETEDVIHRWSLRQLAEMGAPDQNGSVTLRADDAQRLLQDVSRRLKRQETICRQLMDCIDMLEHGERATESKISTTALPLEKSQHRVVRAVNHPVGINHKRWLEKHVEARRAHTKAKKELHNLSVLHADTFKLANSLMENPNVLDRFSPADRHLLAATMEQIRSRHASTVETLADIVIDLRDVHTTTPSLDSTMDTFLRGRMGVQLLCDHYVALNKGKQHGGVAVESLLSDVLEDAMTESRHVCDAHLQKSPEVISAIPVDARLTLIRPWVHHVMVELLKNAMASNVEATPDQCTPPSISIEYAQDEDFVSLHIVDHGVGLHKEGALERAFGFAQSSANRRWDRLEEQQSYAMVRSPLQSLGVGLPLSRIMMCHFGGEVVLMNNDTRLDLSSDQGCTATIKLRRVDSFLEDLPYMEPP